MLSFFKEKLPIEHVNKILEKKPIRILLRLGHISFISIIVFLLITKIGDIGWSDVWKALPSNPLYYAFFLVWYFAIPVTELLVYRLIWQTNLTPYIGIFLRKRVYNLAFISYSGEAVLALWARGRFGLKNKMIYATIKDSNILSALSSNIFTIIALMLFFATGQLSLITQADPDYQLYIGLAILIGLILVPLIIWFRKKIISLPTSITQQVIFIHFFRFMTMLLCQIGMWWVVLPDVAFSTWLLFLTAQLVLQRVPFLPNTDLLFLGLGLSMASLLDAPEAVVAGMFIGAGALAQLFNLVIYVITSFKHSKPKDMTGSLSSPAGSMSINKGSTPI